MEESKHVLAAIQEHLVAHQVADWIDQHRHCSACGQAHRRNGHQRIAYRTLFGKLRLIGQRFYSCSCQSTEQQTFSPIVLLLPERTAPELNYLQTKWAGLVSYRQAVNLLAEVLPMQTNVATVHNKTLAAGWNSRTELPPPDGRMTVGLDGGYVHARDGDNRKAGWFEVIAGKSVTWDEEAKCFGFVHAYDGKPKRRLFELLQSQGLQRNQDITFLSDGGDTVRDIQLSLSPWSEHILDWFHVTMRLTVMKNTAKGLPADEDLRTVAKNLESVKWYLWHGNVFRALTKTLNGELRDTFCRWYPSMTKTVQNLPLAG